MEAGGAAVARRAAVMAAQDALIAALPKVKRPAVCRIELPAWCDDNDSALRSHAKAWSPLAALRRAPSQPQPQPSRPPSRRPSGLGSSPIHCHGSNPPPARPPFQALHAAFVACDEEITAKHKASGTTATLAVQVCMTRVRPTRHATAAQVHRGPSMRGQAEQTADGSHEVDWWRSRGLSGPFAALPAVLFTMSVRTLVADTRYKVTCECPLFVARWVGSWWWAPWATRRPSWTRGTRSWR